MFQEHSSLLHCLKNFTNFLAYKDLKTPKTLEIFDS